MNTINRIVCERRIWKDVKLLHTHEFGQLIFPLKGILTLKTKNQFISMNSRTLFYLPPECKHLFYAQENWAECLVVDIPIFILSDITKLKSESGIYLDMNENWQALRYLILTEVYRKDPSVNHLIFYLFSLLQKQNENSPSLQYIYEHYFENIPLETLARLEHYNVSYYGQWFQKKMGVTPVQYIQKLRLEKAKQLLRETNFSILDITHQIGYNHQSYLTRIFKQVEGITPQQYKNSIKNINNLENICGK